MLPFFYFSPINTMFAGTPGNRTQLCSFATDSGFEGRGEHQLLNHSQTNYFQVCIELYNQCLISFLLFGLLFQLQIWN